MNTYYVEAARLLAQVQRAGARHSAKDNSIIQQLHDLACELGAECPEKLPEGMTLEDLRRYAPNPMLKAAVEALILRHPGHASQKTHGNRHGVGGLREFAERRGYKVREVKGKDGKSSLAITDRNDKRTNMRAGGLTEARKLITSVNKLKRQAARERKEELKITNNPIVQAVSGGKSLGKFSEKDLRKTYLDIALKNRPYLAQAINNELRARQGDFSNWALGKR